MMPKMEKPKGKPTPEMQAKMKVDKATRNDFLAGVMARLSYAEKQKKQCERELDAAAAEGAAAEEVVNEYLNPPSGTRDFYPADKRIQNWLFGEFRFELLWRVSDHGALERMIECRLGVCDSYILLRYLGPC